MWSFDKGDVRHARLRSASDCSSILAALDIFAAIFSP